MHRPAQDEAQTTVGLNLMKKTRTTKSFVLCIENRECEDLEKGKVYRSLPDAKAAREGYVRVVDESGEDYLYPESYLVAIDLPDKAREAMNAIS
jgi:hypothetical protein